MNAQFATKITRFFRCDNWSNADIANSLGINKNTVARIRKIYRDIKWQDCSTYRNNKWQRYLTTHKTTTLAKKHHVSCNVIRAIHKELKNEI